MRHKEGIWLVRLQPWKPPLSSKAAVPASVQVFRIYGFCFEGKGLENVLGLEIRVRAGSALDCFRLTLS